MKKKICMALFSAVLFCPLLFSTKKKESYKKVELKKDKKKNFCKDKSKKIKSHQKSNKDAKVRSFCFPYLFFDKHLLYRI